MKIYYLFFITGLLLISNVMANANPPISRWTPCTWNKPNVQILINNTQVVSNATEQAVYLLNLTNKNTGACPIGYFFLNWSNFTDMWGYNQQWNVTGYYTQHNLSNGQSALSVLVVSSPLNINQNIDYKFDITFYEKTYTYVPAKQGRATGIYRWV